MTHPYKPEHEAGMKGKVIKLADHAKHYESPYKKAERVAGCSIDHLELPKKGTEE